MVAEVFIAMNSDRWLIKDRNPSKPAASASLPSPLHSLPSSTRNNKLSWFSMSQEPCDAKDLLSWLDLVLISAPPSGDEFNTPADRENNLKRSVHDTDTEVDRPQKRKDTQHGPDIFNAADNMSVHPPTSPPTNLLSAAQLISIQTWVADLASEDWDPCVIQVLEFFESQIVQSRSAYLQALAYFVSCEGFMSVVNRFRVTVFAEMTHTTIQRNYQLLKIIEMIFVEHNNVRPLE